MLTTNGQSPFLTLFLQIDDNDPYVEEVAMIVEEVIKQRIQGVKNKKGVYVTPAFPKLVYVLDENNCLKGGKYDYITKLCAECNVKRIYPDYISAKVMRELHEGQVYSCMGCVDGSERVKYSFNGFCYNEPIKEMYDRLSNSFESKLENEQDTRHKYIDLNNVYIYDLKLDKYVSCTRIIRNVQIDWVKVTLSNSYVLDCTVDHPFETENRGIVQAKDLLSSDYILCDTGVESVVDLEFYNTEKFSYDVTTESEHFEISGIYSHNCRSFLSEWKVTEDMKNSCNLPDKVGDYKWEGRFNQGRQLCPLSA